MNKISTSWAILMSSVQLMRQHKKLLWFPLLNFIAIVGIVVFFAMPLFTQMSVFNLSETFPQMLEAMQAAGEEYSEGEHPFLETSVWNFTVLDKGTPTTLLLFLYLPSMFLATFVNVAFYYEIMQAFNGEKVSLRRGFSFARTKLKAILVWSLLAGVVGAIIHKIQENVGFVGQWITGLIGIAWSVASVFAIPVIIREEQQSNPVDYLKKSAQLIKKTWGEGLTGLVSISVVTFLLTVGIIISGIILSIFTTQLFTATLIIVLIVITAIILLMYLSGVARNIYLCGLYIYASEGVAPGPFDTQIFEKAWKVKKQKR